MTLQPWMQISLAAQGAINAARAFGRDHPEAKRNLDELNDFYKTYSTRFYLNDKGGLVIFSKHDMKHFPMSDAPIQVADYYEQVLDVPEGYAYVWKNVLGDQGTTRPSREKEYK